MIRIKTLRRLIFLAEHLVSTYYTTGRSEYLSFDEHLELLDVENIAKALGVSERTAYDYVAAIRELYRAFRSNDMTEQVHTCEDMTDVQEAEIL